MQPAKQAQADLMQASALIVRQFGADDSWQRRLGYNSANSGTITGEAPMHAMTYTASDLRLDNT